MATLPLVRPHPFEVFSAWLTRRAAGSLLGGGDRRRLLDDQGRLRRAGAPGADLQLGPLRKMKPSSTQAKFLDVQDVDHVHTYRDETLA
jgi:hypothetical protein